MDKLHHKSFPDMSEFMKRELARHLADILVKSLIITESEDTDTITFTTTLTVFNKDLLP